MEQEDLAGLLMLLVILVFIVFKCSKPPSQADQLKDSVKTIFDLLDENNEGSVDTAEFFDSIHSERIMKSVFAGDSAKAAVKEHKSDKITWPEFLAWVNTRNSKNK